MYNATNQSYPFLHLTLNGNLCFTYHVDAKIPLLDWSKEVNGTTELANFRKDVSVNIWNW